MLSCKPTSTLGTYSRIPEVRLFFLGGYILTVYLSMLNNTMRLLGDVAEEVQCLTLKIILCKSIVG